MKHGTEYAKRIKELYQQMVQKFGKPDATEATDPIEQLIVGILAECTSYAKAHAACKKIYAQMVDLNELRVTPAMELARTIGDTVPLARVKSQRIIETLNAIRMRQETMELDFLKQRGRREAREYLESLEGTSPFAAAMVVLYSLGGHAIPVDDLTVYVLRKEEIVEPNAGPSDVQGFLERHVAAADSRDFAELLNKYVVSKGSRVAIEKLPETLYPQAEPAEPEAPAEAAAEPEPEPAPEPKPAARDKKKTAATSDADDKSQATARKVAKKSTAAKSSAKSTAKAKKPEAREKSTKEGSTKEKSAKAGPAKEKTTKDKAAVKPRRKKK